MAFAFMIVGFFALVAVGFRVRNAQRQAIQGLADEPHFEDNDPRLESVSLEESKNG
jgi:hypothetical protein